MALSRPLIRPLIFAVASFTAAVALFAALHAGGAAPSAAPLPLGANDYALIAQQHLQKARETGDASWYARADAALAAGRARDPRNAAVLNGEATLALARHDFRAGLRLALASHAAAPEAVRPLGTITDGQVELGRYRDAGRTLQRMVDLKPNLASYARVSYFRELHGDLAGATSAMRLAVDAGGAAPENVAYVQTLLGGLELLGGRIAGAENAYRDALHSFPGYPAALAGLARVNVARGRDASAAHLLRAVVQRLPLPEHVIALGEAELGAGQVDAARRDFALVRVEQRLLASAGVNTDVELALFEADHGSPGRAVGLARRAWAAAPSVRSADALGWALTRAGRAREALPWARRALRLGSRDPLFLYHAGMAASRAGAPAQARTWLARSLALNPRFSALHAPRARSELRRLG